MNKFFIIAVVIFLNTHFSYAGFRIYSGGNLSTLNTNNSYYRTMFLVGVDKTWEKNWYGLSFGLQYIERSSLMKDITMIFPLSDYGYYLDVLFSVRYIELPLLCNIQLKEWHELKFGFNFGPSLGVSVGDYSKSTFSKGFDITNRQEFISSAKNLYYEYDDPGDLFRSQHFSGIFFNVGFNIEYRNIFTEFRYSHGKSEFEYLYGLAMHDEKFRTFEFILGVHLNNKK